MVKKCVVSMLLAMAVVILFYQSSYAFRPDWREEQQRIFEQIPVKPGDVIDSTNWRKVEGMVPTGVLNWLKKGEWHIKIGEFKFDFSPDEAWMKASQKNEGKYKVSENGVIIDAVTGEIPKFIYGDPFPNIDVKNDPLAAFKLMHNQDAGNSRGGSQYNANGSMDWVGEGGFERNDMVEWIKYSFWQRSDGEQDNPEGFKFMELVPVTKPYDSKGVVSMYYRHADGSQDIVYTYIPAIRRVKRMSGSNRSDPVLGSDSCMDDTGGWSGDNSSMIWKLKGEKIFLMPVSDWATKSTRKFKKMSNGTWQQVGGLEPKIIMGFMDADSKGVPWELINITWVPRHMYEVEAVPKDPYYTYGKCDIYLDRNSNAVSIKTIYDKAQEYWKIQLVGMPACEWGERISFNTQNFTLGVDDKTHHASCVFSGGPHMDEAEAIFYFEDNTRVNRSLFTPAALKLWSK